MEGTDCPRNGCLCAKLRKSYDYVLVWACNRTRSPAVARSARRPFTGIWKRPQLPKVTWPLPDDFDDRRLDELLFPKRPLPTPPQPRPGLDFAQLHTQLQAHKHLTLQLLWEEYRENQPDGYGYSRRRLLRSTHDALAAEKC